VVCAPCHGAKCMILKMTPLSQLVSTNPGEWLSLTEKSHDSSSSSGTPSSSCVGIGSSLTRSKREGHDPTAYHSLPSSLQQGAAALIRCCCQDLHKLNISRSANMFPWESDTGTLTPSAPPRRQELASVARSPGAAA
jgi:hypothetical protein